MGGEIKYEFLDEGEANGKKKGILVVQSLQVPNTFYIFFAGLFTINSVTGEVKTHKDLTGRGRTDPYRLLVGAIDGGGHTGDTSLSLYIGDVSANDGVPRFIRPASGEVLSVSEVS